MTKSINYIVHAIYSYVQKLSDYKVCDPKELDVDGVATVREEFLAELRKYMEEYPELLQIILPDMCVNVEKLVESICANATKRYSIPALPITDSFVDVIQTSQEIDKDSYVVTPKYIDMNNIAIVYDKYSSVCGYEEMSVLVFNALLTLPVNSLKFRVVDLQMSGAMSRLTDCIPAALYNDKVVHEELELSSVLDVVERRIEANLKKCNDVHLFNEKKQGVKLQYEIIALTDEFVTYPVQIQNRILDMMNKSARAGVYFLFFVSDAFPKEKIAKELVANEYITILKNSGKRIMDGLVTPALIFFNDRQFNACIEYMKQGVLNCDVGKQSPKEVVFEMADTPYVPITNEISVPVGDGMDFCMNTINHVHAFILGQSGSGKSVFLHSIIGASLLKYAPEDLQLYLLDFKLGGVEFNRYKGVKHIKAMLVDNSDQQISLEILRELRDSMTERGKVFRSAGISNIDEFNRNSKSERMPHVLVVVDECHELFRVDDSIPRAVSAEISDIVTKIAKEGRSQGVHLVFATQTLSGTEISSEILNNISDYYLLKCSQTDSERLVSNSSDITSVQTTGLIYYYHVDEQMQFQSNYFNKEESEGLIASVIKKTDGHNSNGEFYFSGSQLFSLDADIIVQNRKVKKYPVAYIGKSVDLKQRDLSIVLHDDFSENILVVGLNDAEQATRTMINMLLSLIMASKIGSLDVSIKVINCLSNEESVYEDLLDDMEDEGMIEVIGRKERASCIKSLSEEIKEGTAKETILVVLGQDRFRELKLDMELEVKDEDSTDAFSLGFAGFSNSGNSINSFRQALDFILDKGPEQGVHSIIQVEKVTNLMFADMIAKEVFMKFKHLILLRSDEMTASRLNLRDDIRLENLSREEERLRAYYYAEESDTYTMFTPYTNQGNSNVLKQFAALK